MAKKSKTSTSRKPRKRNRSRIRIHPTLQSRVARSERNLRMATSLFPVGEAPKPLEELGYNEKREPPKPTGFVDWLRRTFCE